jgi:hypothetical protein
MSVDGVINGTEPFILIEGPMWGDAEFYGKWLLAAAKAQALWKTAIKDPNFEKQIEQLSVLPEFSLSASFYLFQVQKNLVSFTIPLNSVDWGEVEEFTLMAEMGFFVVTGQRYQMAIPQGLSTEKVKMAALKFAQTEDEECVLSPPCHTRKPKHGKDAYVSWIRPIAAPIGSCCLVINRIPYRVMRWADLSILIRRWAGAAWHEHEQRDSSGDQRRNEAGYEH